jgi:hypothetical protein
MVPSSGAPGESLAFSVSPLDVWSSVAGTTWSFGDGGTATGTTASHAFPAPGGYDVTVNSMDSLGNTSSATRQVGITAPPAVPPAPDVDRPFIGELSMLRNTFAVGAAPTAVNARRRARPKKGSAFRFALSEDARVTITIARRRPGRKVGRRCVKPTRKNRRRKRCNRFVRRGVLNRNSTAGRNNVPFSGRIGSRALKPGRYRATIVATDAGGNVSVPVRISFRIVR